MAVGRLRYNDHGPTYSKIISGSALEVFRILRNRMEPTTVKDGVCDIYQNLMLQASPTQIYLINQTNRKLFLSCSALAAQPRI